MENVNKLESERESDRSALLRAELTELNNRSRWYSSQLWQIPFAYLGLSAIAIGQTAEKSKDHLGAVVAASAAFGVLVLFHAVGAWRSENRVVHALIYVEKQLGLPENFRARHSFTALPMVLGVVMAVVA